MKLDTKIKLASYSGSSAPISLTISEEYAVIIICVNNFSADTGLTVSSGTLFITTRGLDGMQPDSRVEFYENLNKLTTIKITTGSTNTKPYVDIYGIQYKY